jgi:4-amino-4-deoxy-L-arabinose transferase-like glycosyltransferase
VKRLLLILFGLTAWRAWVVLHVHAGLQVDEAQYWFWSEHLDWGYFSKPPGIAALIKASTSLFGDGLLGVKALAMLCYPLTALVLAGWARDVGAAPRQAGLAALLFIASPAAGLLGLAVTTDAPLLLCWALASWSLWRAWRDGAWRDWLLLGLWVGLGAMSKYTMGAFALTAFGFLLTVQRDRPRAVPLWRGLPVAVAIALACVAPNLAWNASHGWPTLEHTAEITVGAEASNTWSTLGEYLGGLVLLLGPLVTLWAVWARVGGVRAAADRAAWGLVAWLVAPLTAIGLAQSLHAKAQVNWTAPVLIGLVLAVVLSLSQRRRGLHAVLLAQVLLVGAVTQAGDIAHALGRPLPRQLDVWARMRGWEAAFNQLRPALQAYWQRQQALDPTLPRAVLGGNRTVISHAAYAWRDLDPQWRAWREPGQRPQDHYQLTVPLQPTGQLRPLLYVGEGPPGASLQAALREPPQRLAVVDLEQTPGRWIHLELWSGVLRPQTSVAVVAVEPAR